MSFKEIEREAIALPEVERATLVRTLLETLRAPGAEISDEEVERRDAGLESGAVQAITHDEFVHRVNAERKRRRWFTTQRCSGRKLHSAPLWRCIHHAWR